MDKKTEETMAANLHRNTGKSLEDWIVIARSKGQAKHGDTVKWLKETYDLGLFFADLIVHKANGTDAGSMDDEALISMQYKGKDHLRPIYDHLLMEILGFGDDVEVAPKKAYVSLRRKKQFACLKPATKNRFEIELILKGEPASDLLHAITGAGAMCTHRICISDLSELSDEIYTYLNRAYTKAT